MFEFLLYDSLRPSTPSTSRADVQRISESAVMPIEHRLDRLELACAGLWTLLKTKHGYSDEELVACIQEVDARDGKVDGKIGKVQGECPHCHRKLLTRDSPKCVWCGGVLAARPL